MVNHFYLKGIQSSADVKVAYLTLEMPSDQEMLIVSMDFRCHGVTLRELEFFPHGTILLYSRLSEMPTDVFNNVVEKLVRCKWDFSECVDPFAIVVQGAHRMYKRKKKPNNKRHGK